MSTTNSRNMIIISSIALLSLMLAACGSAKEAPVTVPAGAPAGDLVGLEPCTYKAGDVEYAADCGTLVVPENRADPNSRLIALPVIRVRATSDNPAEPIFYFAGGPGQSNLHFQHLEDVVENHDLVQVGYRGVDGSVVLDCPEISKAVREARVLLRDEALESYTAAGASCARRLQAEGVDLAGYTLAETIDDNEDARVALGYNRINLLGGSYGTRLQMIYEWMYPDSLHRVIMLAVNPPGRFVWDTEVIDEQIEDYARLCAQDPDCNARTDDLAASMRNLSEDLPDRWLFFPIDEGGIKILTLFMLFDSIQPPGMPVPLSGPAAVDMWLAAEGGDASGMALASMSRNLFLPTLWTWGEGLSLAASVDDYHDPARDYRSEFEAPDTILGSPMSLMLWSLGLEWPAHPIPQEYLQVQPTDIETLLIGGSIDFSTPPQFATEELLPYLSNGEQVILEDFGHTDSFWNSQPGARVHMLNTFFDTGQVDASLYTYQPLDFDVGLGWPGLAKLLVAVVVLVPILSLVLVWWIIRWAKRHRASQVSD
ncbi:MAG TPA: alpha/beta hydrolase [Anaerolineae bacterium]|nr:alpha/beta hydrolase [Anaerolineae bacterium]